MLVDKKATIIIEPHTGATVKAFGILEVPCNDGKDVLIAITDKPEKYLDNYVACNEPVILSGKNLDEWNSIISKANIDNSVDKFYEILFNVLVPLFRTHEIPGDVARIIAIDILNNRQGVVTHYHNDDRATDIYNVRKFLNQYRDFINRFSTAYKEDDKKYVYRFIDAAFKYTNETYGDEENDS